MHISSSNNKFIFNIGMTFSECCFGGFKKDVSNHNRMLKVIDTQTDFRRAVNTMVAIIQLPHVVLQVTDSVICILH